MAEYIEIIVGLVAIVGFLCTVINYTVIKPQSLVISKLERVVENLDTIVTDIRERVVAGEVRIDDLLERVNMLEDYHKQPPMMGGRRK